MPSKADITSWALFLAASACIAIASALDRYAEYLAPLALIAGSIGFFVGTIALLGSTRARRANVLISLGATLANTLILAVCYLAIPQPTRRFSPRSACIANLKQLNGAKCVWALEFHRTNHDIPSDSDLFGVNAYIHTKPVCPEGGTYRIGTVDQLPRCSVPEHTL